MNYADVIWQLIEKLLEKEQKEEKDLPKTKKN